jgi:hypothetical protein
MRRNEREDQFDERPMEELDKKVQVDKSIPDLPAIPLYLVAIPLPIYETSIALPPKQEKKLVNSITRKSCTHLYQ